MVFNRFRVKVIIRIVVLAAVISAAVYLFFQPGKEVTGAIVVAVGIAILAELFRFVEQTNRKLTRFLESIRYSDFISGFASGESLGHSFKDLNHAFTEVIEAFRKARSEKEEHWLYLNTVVQHVNTGLFSFDTDGNIELTNALAKKFLGISLMRNISDLEPLHPDFVKVIMTIKPGGNQLIRIDTKTHLAVHSTELRLRGKTYKLISLQNIQSELQQKEIEAWQNLTRVLRHEIMNSITPIASLTSTLKDILMEDLQEKDGYFELQEEGMEDLQEGLRTIESRSQGLIRFIDAYRDYTSIPEPHFTKTNIRDLIEHVTQLMKVEIRKSKIELECNFSSDQQLVEADEELIEQVLINIIKNSLEALKNAKNPKVTISCTGSYGHHQIIQIKDNGQGIVPEALERIFIPFYTTKRTGSGIGLSLSRQIMQLHHGSLTVESEPNVATTFTLTF